MLYKPWLGLSCFFNPAFFSVCFNSPKQSKNHFRAQDVYFLKNEINVFTVDIQYCITITSEENKLRTALQVHRVFNPQITVDNRKDRTD